MKVQVRYKINGDGCINILTYFNVRGVSYINEGQVAKLVLLYPVAKQHEIILNSQVDFINIDDID